MPTINTRIIEEEEAALLIVAEAMERAEHRGRHDGFGLGEPIVLVEVNQSTARRAARAIKRIVEDRPKVVSPHHYNPGEDW